VLGHGMHVYARIRTSASLLSLLPGVGWARGKLGALVFVVVLILSLTPSDGLLEL
jgi:hypothetical protein